VPRGAATSTNALRIAYNRASIDVHTVSKRILVSALLALAACKAYDTTLLDKPRVSESRRACSDHSEQCNGVDDDCDGIIDEGASAACSLPRARSRCQAGTCVLDRCDEGFLSCDGVADNGCEHDVAACGACEGTCDKPAHAGEPAPPAVASAGRGALAADGGYSNDDAGADPREEDAGQSPCSPERCDGRDNDCDERSDEGGVCCVARAPTGQGEACDRCVCEHCSSALDHCLATGNAEWDASCGALMRCWGTNTVAGSCSEDDDCGTACASAWVGAGWRPNRECSPDNLSWACGAFELVRATCYQTKCAMACKH